VSLLDLDPESLTESVLACVDQAVAQAVAPLLERMAALTARIEIIEKMQRDGLIACGLDRERLVRLEATQTTTDLEQPVAGVIDRALGPVFERLAGTEARIEVYERSMTALQDRIAARETAGRSGQEEPSARTFERELGALEARVAMLAPLMEGMTDLRERIAACDARPSVPGPAGANGADGQPGRDGAAGRDGLDGLGFGELGVDYDGERTLVIKATQGERTKVLAILTLPIMIFRGIFEEGRTYQPHDVVKWARGMWICLKETIVKPTRTAAGPQGKDFWFPVVEPGRDGRDGKDGPPGPVGKPGKNFEQMLDEMRGTS